MNPQITIQVERDEVEFLCSCLKQFESYKRVFREIFRSLHYPSPFRLNVSRWCDIDYALSSAVMEGR